MKIIGLICAYREQKTIREVVRKTSKYVDKLIVVNDGSDDLTGIILAKETFKNKKLWIVDYFGNRGKGYALKQGFKKFLELDGDILVTLDADGQHDPEDIKNLVSLIENRAADVVIGARYLRNMPRNKVILNTIANLGLLMASGTFFSDVSSGYRAYSKEAVEEILPSMGLDKFGIELEILKACAENEIRVGVVPVACNYKEGKKTNLKRLASGYFQFAWKYKRDMLHHLLVGDKE